MRKYILFVGLVIFFNSLLFGQSVDVDFTQKTKFISAYMERGQGRFTITAKEKNARLLYYNGLTDPGRLGSAYRSHANFKINNQVFTMHPDVKKGATLVTPINSLWGNDNDILTVGFNCNEVEIKQELIPIENIDKKAGAILIKYTFTNKSSETKKVAVALKLDTYIGEDSVDLIPDDPNGGYVKVKSGDTARVAIPTGFIKERKIVNPIPDYWLAFEDEDPNKKGIIAKGTLRGKDLVCPDFLYVGQFACETGSIPPEQTCDDNIFYLLFEDSLQEGGRYYDSGIFMIWDEREIGPNESDYVATLYGMAGTDGCDDGSVFLINSEPPFDALTVDDNGNYQQTNPFNYMVTIRSYQTFNNVRATINFDNRFFELVNNDPFTKYIGTLEFGTAEILNWRLRFKEEACIDINSATQTISVTVTDGVSSTPCATNIHIDPKYLLNLQYDHTTGNATKEPNKDKYYCDETVSIQAYPNTGYKFGGWEGITENNMLNPTNVRMNGHKTITAKFIADSSYLDITIDPPVAATTTPAAGRHKIKNGEIINLKIIPDECYVFDRWEFTGSGLPDPPKSDTCSFAISSDVKVTAHLSIKKLTLTTDINVTGAATIKINHEDGQYNCGETATLTVTPDFCYRFVRWDDGDTNNPRSYTMKNDINHEAILDKKQFTLNSSTDYPNSGAVNPQTYICDCGETIKLTVIPNCGYSFVKWSDGDTNVTRNIAMYKDTSLTANMAKILFDVPKSEPNIFPNIVVNLEIDSAWYTDGVWEPKFKITAFSRSQFTVIDEDTVGNSTEIKNFNLVGSQIVYSLYGNCYDKVSDLKRRTIIEFNYNGCKYIDSAMYTIDLNAGCDSCSTPLKRKLTPNKLFQNRPNPYNPETRIKYSIADDDKVFIAVYDILGKEVARLVNEHQEAGEYEVVFRPKNLPSGVYFYRMKTSTFQDVKKMSFIK
jgi:hypothetical protein